MELKEYLLEIEEFLKKYLEESHCKAYVLGLSGGVDSSLVAAIARKALGKDKLFCYALDIDSNPADVEDAKKVAKDHYAVAEQVVVEDKPELAHG